MRTNLFSSIIMLSAFFLTSCQSMDLSLPTLPDFSKKDTLKAPTYNEDQWLIHANSSTLQTGNDDQYWQLPNDIWMQLRTRFHQGQFANVKQARVDAYIEYYRKRPQTFNTLSKRASKYIYFIEQAAREKNIPAELVLLPIIESSFDVFAYSHGQAAGLWQFIPSTGKMLGLKQDWWYDGRRDIYAATYAAFDYLNQMHDFFDGDWFLAISAYNAGPGTIQRAQRKNRAEGKPDDYWSLTLPDETMKYVPKLLALAEIMNDPNKYGITLKSVPKQAFLEKINIDSQIDLAQAAKLADISVDDLYALNPAFNKWATSPDGPHYLLIPTANADTFRSNYQQLPKDKRVVWQRHTVTSGDNLLYLAQKYQTQVKVIKDFNSLTSDNLSIGQTLMIPTASASADIYKYSDTNRLATKQNKRPAPNRFKTDYIVKSGDSFWTISRKFNVNYKHLAKWNSLAPADALRIGQKLVVWRKVAKDEGAITRKVGYKVRSGESLYVIAQKFKVKVADIRTWNSLTKKYIQPGQHLTLYVDVTKVSVN